MIHKTVQGMDVPALGFGTYLLKSNECRQGVEDALEIGYRHIDTAQSYGNEAEVGQALEASGLARSDVFLTTKVWMDKLEPDLVRSSTEESLRKLRTDYVDLLLIHWPNDDVPVEATLDAMLELKSEERTRTIGVSNFTPALLRRSLAHADVFCNQVEYHPFLDQSELLELAREHDLLLTAYSPIARGEVLREESLQEIGRSHDKSPVQISLRWLIQQENVVAVPKAARAEHRRHNFDIFDFELGLDEMSRITNLARGSRIVNPSWAPGW